MATLRNTVISLLRLNCQPDHVADTRTWAELGKVVGHAGGGRRQVSLLVAASIPVSTIATDSGRRSLLPSPPSAGLAVVGDAVKLQMTETTWSVSIAFGWRPEDEPTPSSIVNSHARPFCGSLSGSGPVTVAREVHRRAFIALRASWAV